MGEPCDLTLNVHQVPVSCTHPCLGPQPTCIISLSESKTVLLLFMTALPSLSLHNFYCHYCLIGIGCTQSKVSTTYSSENALGGRKLCLALFAGAIDHSVFSVSKCCFGGTAKLLLLSCWRFCSLLIGGGTRLSSLCIIFKFINHF